MEDKQIGVFKLITGEELISEFVIDKDMYVLRKPRQVYLMQVGPNQFGLKIRPWVVSNENGTFPLHVSSVITVSSEIEESLKNGYITETSGIDMSQATPQKLVGV